MAAIGIRSPRASVSLLNERVEKLRLQAFTVPVVGVWVT